MIARKHEDLPHCDPGGDRGRRESGEADDEEETAHVGKLEQV